MYYINNVLHQHYPLHVSEKPVGKAVFLPMLCSPDPDYLQSCIVVPGNTVVVRNHYT